jgi:hypothetical protein
MRRPSKRSLREKQATAISQAELADVLAQNESLNRRMVDIRERINKGARIEPGELTAEAEDDDDDDGGTRSLSVLGLYIVPAADLVERDALIEEARRDRDRRDLAPPEEESANATESHFAGNLSSARSRFADVSSVFLRCAEAKDLNWNSYQLAGILGTYYGLTDLSDTITREIRDDRKAVELRSKLVVVEFPSGRTK